MTSGRPFSQREDDFIKQNCNEQYPSLIARALVMNFTEDNGGVRSTKAVTERMAYWVEQMKEPPELLNKVVESKEQEKPRFDARKLNKGKSKTSSSESN